MILEALIARIVSLGLGKEGRDRTVYDSSMPATVNAGVLLRLPLDGVPVDNHLPGYYDTRLQIIVRDTDYSNGRDLANALFRQFPMRQEKELNDRYLIKRILPAALPIPFPRLEGNSHEWSLNFYLTFVDREES